MKTNREKCIDMWRWLAMSGGPKIDYFQKKGILIIPPCLCYACEECYDNCQKCPVKWSNLCNSVPCGNPDSPYLKWVEAKNRKDRQKAASLVLKTIKETWKED